VNTNASGEHQCIEPVQAAGGSGLLADAMGVDADGKRGGRITVGAAVTNSPVCPILLIQAFGLRPRLDRFDVLSGFVAPRC
jgi:hypothetical protein